MSDVTKMVNNPFIRLLVLPLVPPDPEQRKIAGGPIYDLDVVQQIIRHRLTAGERAVWIGNESAEDALANDFFPPWDEQDVPPLLLALTKADRICSEWAKTSNGTWFDCDVYVMGYNRNRQIRWPEGSKIYVKFGMSRNKPLCVVVRVHPSRNAIRK